MVPIYGFTVQRNGWVSRLCKHPSHASYTSENRIETGCLSLLEALQKRSLYLRYVSHMCPEISRSLYFVQKIRATACRGRQTRRGGAVVCQGASNPLRNPEHVDVFYDVSPCGKVGVL